jgi:Tol biopolymer transport system component
VGDEANYGDLQLSPDGTRASVSLPDPVQRTRNIWLIDVVRGVPTRLMFDPADEHNPVWSPDGMQLVFNSRRKGHLDLYRKPASGAGGEEELLIDGFDKFPLDWSSDGRFILFNWALPETGLDLGILPLFGDRKPFAFMQTTFDESFGRFSPNGRWIAFISEESGREQVYVAPFPGPGRKVQVSNTGASASGGWPRWRQDGRELFYVGPTRMLMAASIATAGDAVQIGEVRSLFQLSEPAAGMFRGSYDVSPDGQRFLVNTVVDEGPRPPITLVVNWPALLKR